MLSLTRTNLFRRELHYVRMKSTVSAITRQFVLSGKTVAIAISLLTLAASGTELNIYTTFITFAWMSFLHIALFDLVVTVKILAELSTSLNRIQDFLTLNAFSTKKRFSHLKKIHRIINF